MRKGVAKTYAEALAGKAKRTFELGKVRDEPKKKTKPKEVNDFWSKYINERDAAPGE